jgi:hypothetical protein
MDRWLILHDDTRRKEYIKAGSVIEWGVKRERERASKEGKKKKWEDWEEMERKKGEEKERV